jgi:hypothetical protein
MGVPTGDSSPSTAFVFMIRSCFQFEVSDRLITDLIVVCAKQSPKCALREPAPKKLSSMLRAERGTFEACLRRLTFPAIS